MIERPTVKEQVLQTLEERKGESVSGEMLAEQLGVSRTAVWKAINSLRDAGYTITAGTNRGYCLEEGNELLSAQGIRPFLEEKWIDVPIYTYKTLESTNKTAKQLALENAIHGTAVFSNRQTSGRGRLGRDFFSPDSTGIYMSILLKPDFDITKSVLVTTAASVAVARAIEKLFDVECKIKWVNDIYIDNRKVCGILTEAVTNFESGQIEYVVLGIGINCTPPSGGFPPELRSIAGSICPDPADAAAFPRNNLAAELINQVLDVIENLSARSFIKEYRERSLVVGKEISVIRNGVPTPGKALYIDNDGALIVQLSTGGMHTLNSGEISIRLT